MNVHRPNINDAINTAAEAAVRRADRSKKIARARRIDVVLKFIGEMIVDLLVALGAAWPLMLGIDSFGISAPYWGCVFLIMGVRWALNISSPSDR